MHPAYAETLNRRVGVNFAGLGSLFLDDMLGIQARGGTAPGITKDTRMDYSVFLFEGMLVCCLDGDSEGDAIPPCPAEPEFVVTYPIVAWDIGPACRRNTPLNVVHAIPTRHLKVLRYSDFGKTPVVSVFCILMQTCTSYRANL